VLLNGDYYHTTLKPILAQWAVLWLKQQGMHINSDAQETAVLSFISGKRAPILDIDSPRDFRMLNLACDWITCFVPHILQKIDR
jgi:hypothetical protein